MTLIQHVRSRHLGETLFVYKAGCLMVKDLQNLEQRYGLLLQKVAGRRVALAFRSMPLLAEALLLLDGLCEQILLLPADLEESTVAHFVEASGTTLVLTDHVDSLFDALLFTVDAGTPPQRHAETIWLLPTSGTTGTPKLVRHSLLTLSRSVRQGGRKERPDRWGLLYEINRFSGLQVYLQALLGGGTLIIPEHRDVPLLEQLDLFAGEQVNALSATPTLWRKMLMSGGLNHLPLTQITLGGEIATQAILDVLASTFPQARLSHVYASTEFGVGFSVSDGSAGFPAVWLDDSTTGFVYDSVSGELCIRQGEELHGTGDQIEIQGERAFFVGRINGSINVGGNKVMPETVEHVLLQHPSVALVAVSALRSPIMGNLVKADIVLRPQLESVAELRRDLTEHCRRHLESFQVPAIINFVDTIALSINGKIRRI